MDDYQIWVIDRSKLFLEGLKMLLRNSAFDLSVEATSMAEVDKQSLDRASPDLILIGIHTSLGEGTEEEAALQRLCGTFPGTPVVVLSDTMSMAQLKSAMKAGASGYLLRNITSTALKHSLSLVIAGEKVLPTELVSILVTERTFNGPRPNIANVKLSARERLILHCLSEGSSNKLIAHQLNIAEATVKVHIKAVFKKIGARNRTDAAVWALNHAFEMEDQ